MEKSLINLPKLNFNLLVFIAGLIAIGFGEANQSCTLYLFGVLGAAAGLISLFFSLLYYTRHYCLKTKKISK